MENILGEDPNIELPSIENSQGEPSPLHPFPSWQPFDAPPPPSQDSSSPGKYILHFAPVLMLVIWRIGISYVHFKTK